jgi:hypothetical protein
VVFQSQSPKSEIRSLFLVVFSGIVCAFLLSLLLLYYYGPSGRYALRNILLSPNLIQNLSYQDLNPKTKKVGLFIFEKIEFSYYDGAVKKWLSVPVLKETYEKFYSSINRDVSLIDVHPQIQELFYEGNLSQLSIKAITDSSNQKQITSEIFQEVHFTKKGDHYRVRLREQSRTSDNWAYFYHEGIGQEVMKLFL